MKKVVIVTFKITFNPRKHFCKHRQASPKIYIERQEN